MATASPVDALLSGTRAMFNAFSGQLSRLIARIAQLEAQTNRVIESGKNPNGRYTRYEDGTLICELSTKSWSVTPEDWSNWPGPELYYLRTPTYSFPALFVEPPILIAELDEYAWRRSQGRGDTTVSTSGCNLSFIRETAATFNQSRLSIRAVGRWKA